MPDFVEIKNAASELDRMLVLAYLSSESLKANGFAHTLAALKKKKFTNQIGTVLGGVVERQPSGLYDAALNTDFGPVVLRNAERTDDADVQLLGSITAPTTPAQIIDELNESAPHPSLVCLAEFAKFDTAQNLKLLPALWQFIIANRDSNDREVLIAVGSAIRKYVATMPLADMGKLSVLLESGSRSQIPISLEIEVAKMVYRCFEAEPPVESDPQPKLAASLWEIAQAYTNPRVLLRDKYSTASSLAILAIVAMRSNLAQTALKAVQECPFKWFREVVQDDLDRLQSDWSSKSSSACEWLVGLRAAINF